MEKDATKNTGSIAPFVLFRRGFITVVDLIYLSHS